MNESDGWEMEGGKIGRGEVRKKESPSLLMYDHGLIQSGPDRESGSHTPNRNGLNRGKKGKKIRWNTQIEFRGHFSPVKRDFIGYLVNFRLRLSDF